MNRSAFPVLRATRSLDCSTRPSKTFSGTALAVYGVPCLLQFALGPLVVCISPLAVVVCPRTEAVTTTSTKRLGLGEFQRFLRFPYISDARPVNRLSIGHRLRLPHPKRPAFVYITREMKTIFRSNLNEDRPDQKRVKSGPAFYLVIRRRCPVHPIRSGERAKSCGWQMGQVPVTKNQAPPGRVILMPAPLGA